MAIDPGPTETAWVVLIDGRISNFGKQPNDEVRRQIALHREVIAECVIEQVTSYGMAVGAEVFETCVWTGRFMEAFDAARCSRVPRLKVKLHHCHDSKAKDGNIRQAIIDRFGGKEHAIGTKKQPGPLYGIKADCWQALALALYWHDTASYRDAVLDAARRAG